MLRTFSKAYGLAGLRVGYAIAGDPTVAAAIGQTQVPFSVTTVAQAAALASLEAPAQEQMQQRVAEVVRERERVRDALLGLGLSGAAHAGQLRVAAARRRDAGLGGAVRAARR